MEGWMIAALVIVGLILLPIYLLFLSKFVQVGKLAGTKWFLHRHGKKEKLANGTHTAE